MQKKIVLKVNIHDDRDKQKAMKAVSSLKGVDEISVDMKEKKLTVTGDVDPVTIVSKLRKLCHPEIVTVGPAKEEKKKEEPKKEPEKKKAEPKKEPKPEKKNKEPEKKKAEPRKEPKPEKKNKEPEKKKEEPKKEPRLLWKISFWS